MCKNNGSKKLRKVEVKEKRVKIKRDKKEAEKAKNYTKPKEHKGCILKNVCMFALPSLYP